MPYLNKVTTKEIGLDREVLFEIAKKGKGEVVPVCRFVGQATKQEVGENNNGAWVKFVGMFAAVNYQTGEEFRAGACCLPNIASNIVEGMLGKASEGEGTGGVQFAFELGIRYEKDLATGYVFTCDSLIQGADPLASLMEQLPDAPKPTKKLAA